MLTVLGPRVNVSIRVQHRDDVNIDVPKQAVEIGIVDQLMSWIGTKVAKCCFNRPPPPPPPSFQLTAFTKCKAMAGAIHSRAWMPASRSMDGFRTTAEPLLETETEG